MADFKVTCIQADGVVKMLENIEPGRSLMEVARANNVAGIHGDCGGTCACATCHVIIREGFEALDPASDEEDDQLDRAWGVQPTSRLACQVVVRQQDLVVELPRYTINLASEHD